MKLGQTHADGRRLLAVAHSGSHVLDSAAGDGQGAVHKRTEELVASDADKRVIGPQMLLDRVCDRAQEPVAGDMAAVIVDLFESVDVDVGKHEVPVPTARAGDLALEDEHAHHAAEGARELVDLRTLELGRCLLMIAIGRGAICGGRDPVARGAFAISGRLVTV